MPITDSGASRSLKHSQVIAEKTVARER
jgi:hypothetical protein